MESLSEKDDDPIGAEEVALQPYLTYLIPASSNKPLILKMLQDPDLISGYNRISSEDEKIQNTLNLFSYGNIAEYETDRSKFLPLGDKHLRQLKRLSILATLENTQTNEISYAALQQASQTTDEVQFEQNMCHLIASRVVSGKLSQRKKLFLLRAIHRPRDTTNTHELTNNLRVLRARIQDAATRLHGAQTSLQEQGKKQAIVQATLQKVSEESSRAENLSAAMEATSRRQKRNRGGGLPMLAAGQLRFGEEF